VYVYIGCSRFFTVYLLCSVVTQTVHMADNSSTAGEPHCLRISGGEGFSLGLRSAVWEVSHQKSQVAASLAQVRLIRGLCWLVVALFIFYFWTYVRQAAHTHLPPTPSSIIWYYSGGVVMVQS